MQESATFEPTVPAAVRRYWLLVVSSALGGALLGLFMANVVFDNSKAVATILIEDDSRVFDTGRAVQPQRYLASQVAILGSPDMAQAVADLDLVEEIGTSQILEARTIISSPETDLIGIEFVDPDPKVAILYANAYVEAYQAYRNDVTTNAYNAAISELASAIEAVEQELAAVDVEIAAGPSNGGGNDPEAQLELAILLETRRDIMGRRSQLVVLRDQLRLDAVLTSSGIVAISEAREAVPTVGRGRIIVILGVLGAIGGVTLSYALALRNRRFGQRSEPELVLGVPGLAEIPELRAKDLPVLDDPTSKEAETFRFAASAIVARLAQLETTFESERRNSVTITSALKGEGKTIVTINVGLSLATGGKSVLIIDGNFADPTLSQMMAEGTGDHAGITDIVEGDAALADVVIPVNLGEDQNVDVLARGTVDISGAEVFNASYTEKLFNLLQLRYDYVLVDAPSILQNSYTSSLVRLTDAVVTVIPHNGLVSTQPEVLKRIEIVEANLVGYIYNRAPRRSDM